MMRKSFDNVKMKHVSSQGAAGTSNGTGAAEASLDSQRKRQQASDELTSSKKTTNRQNRIAELGFGSNSRGSLA